ncbi:protease HtpX [Selenihalanaerobacter shriftii]|uniref:Heat shock protein HtpX n=1 Tax=Selenihalanaerobacter shriftii TaxID=142842 RepID=A0A1T4JK39_9FIRM|nr:protease HtpX [Selenihalanaerobacter shriftii]SJZ30540.1 heat shock protein HtpX [Selenihalanaerobacter shriftii]
MKKRLGFFFAVNAGIIATMSIVLQGFTPGFIIIPLLGSAGAFVSLFFSKWLAKKAHGVYIIDPQNFSSELEKDLYELVTELSNKANLSQMPEIGIYDSPDMNAFATGMRKSSSMVAFSTALLENMDYEGVHGVAAHEISHIANGDMVTMTLIQAVVNTIVLIITLPLRIFGWVSLFSDEASFLSYLLITIARFIATLILTFVGSLIVKLFSRHREFEADKSAAKLIGGQSMIHALKLLAQDTKQPPKLQQSYASLKVSSPRKFFDIFSTHPSLERRIEKLKN